MRFLFLDTLRTCAIFSMIIFHTSYDLRIFQFTDWDFSKGFWYAFPRVIAFTFLFCVGISSYLTHHNKLNKKSLTQRSLKLGTAAMVVSLSSYFFYPNYWIYFGTLHCILVGSILSALLVNKKKTSWVLLILILTLQYAFDYDIKWVSSLFNRQSMDFIPIYPWFWVILLGQLVTPKLITYFPEKVSPQTSKLMT